MTRYRMRKTTILEVLIDYDWFQQWTHVPDSRMCPSCRVGELETMEPDGDGEYMKCFECGFEVPVGPPFREEEE